MSGSTADSRADWSSVVDVLRHRAASDPDGLAFSFLAYGERPGAGLTYGQLDRQARAIGAVVGRHVGPGERALLLFPPGLDFVSAFFGCLGAGVVAVPTYPPRPNRPPVATAAIAALSVMGTKSSPFHCRYRCMVGE